MKHEIQPGMPFQGAQLSAEQIARIGDWINAGAPYEGRWIGRRPGRSARIGLFRFPKNRRCQ